MQLLSAGLEQVVLHWFEDLDTSFSLMCAILWRHGEREALVRLECRPEDYETPERYFRSVSALAFVKKLKGLMPNDLDRREAAVKKWFEGEFSCYKANQRLYPYLPGTNLERDDGIAQHLAGIRKVVWELIGNGPPALLQGRHGPGATFADRGYRTTVPHKMSSSPTLTRDAVWFLPQFFGTAWGSCVAHGEGVRFVAGNRFTTVSKTSLIDRSIAVEPSINVFYQLAIGRALRSALRRSHGWDLDHAQELHRRKAKEASETREFATLDLSNASDTVSRNLVKLLIPRGWFDVLDSLRSPKTSQPSSAAKSGSWVLLEKFSSMGNGYTFELETVLFAAACIYCARLHGGCGVLGEDVYVFGDDIIVRDEVVRSLTALLNFLGFSLNSSKSYSGGSPFRESCGADFMSGVDVRPSYLKEDPQDVQAAFGVANRLCAAEERLAHMGSHTTRLAWTSALRQIPYPYRRCRGPKGLGDSVIWDREESWGVRWRNSIRYVRGLKAGDRRVVRYDRFAPQVVLACATYGAGNVGTPEGGRIPDLEGVYPRDCVRSYVVGWLACS